MPSPAPVQLIWELETPASIEATWALFGDTDRFNRAVGFGFRFEETQRADGTVKRTGTAKALGVVNLRWEERPFRYRVPEWFKSVRLFEGSPAERLETELELQDRGGSTAIKYTVSVTPRSAWTKPIVALELKTVTRPKIDAAFKTLLARLAGQDTRYDPLPPPLPADAEARLLDAVPRVPPPVGEKLATLLREAPEADQAQIHALQLGQAWQVTEDHVLDGILAAVREGMLELRWDLLCPSCRGPKQSVASLADVPESVHCPSCNITYDGTFPDSIVVTFKPAPTLRRLDVPVACLGSPFRTPHVLASEELDPSGSTTLRVTLPQGAYRIRTLPERDVVSLMVRDDAPDAPLKLAIQTRALQPARLVARPGVVEIAVDNYAGVPLTLMLEDRALPQGVLTMGRLLERPRAVELLPPEAVMPGMDVVTRHGTVLAVQALDDQALARAERAVQSAEVVRVSPQGLVAVWTDFAPAVRVAATLSRDAALQLALNPGPVTHVTLGDRGLPVGSTVEGALGALVGAAEGHAAIPVTRADSAEVRAVLDAHIQLIKVDFGLSSGVRVHWLEFKT